MNPISQPYQSIIYKGWPFMLRGQRGVGVLVYRCNATLYFLGEIMRLRSIKPKHLLNNVVAKHAKKYNVAVTHKDKKKASKRGYSKHKSIHVEV